MKKLYKQSKTLDRYPWLFCCLNGLDHTLLDTGCPNFPRSRSSRLPPFFHFEDDPRTSSHSTILLSRFSSGHTPRRGYSRLVSTPRHSARRNYTGRLLVVVARLIATFSDGFNLENATREITKCLQKYINSRG